MLSIGIVGLPNVGKSTIFHALSKAPAEASNYPFCTIDPNVGVVTVADDRLSAVAEVIRPKKTTYAAIQFVDIAGLIRGASEGEGLGNQFLHHIRECQAIAEVVRFFADENVVHVDGSPNPDSDTETILTELALADLSTVEKRLVRLTKESKSDPKGGAARIALLERVKGALEDGRPARAAIVTEGESEELRDLHLLTLKPHLYIANVSEEQLSLILSGDEEMTARLHSMTARLGSQVLPICAKVEAELADLSAEEATEYREALGYHDSGLEDVVRGSYALLGLISFFTAGETETRAWTVTQGASAPQAAGEIHTDFEKGFIKAEVIFWRDLVDSGSWATARGKGAIRIEGKDYIIRDGDVANFRFNV